MDYANSETVVADLINRKEVVIEQDAGRNRFVSGPSVGSAVSQPGISPDAVRRRLLLSQRTFAFPEPIQGVDLRVRCRCDVFLLRFP